MSTTAGLVTEYGGTRLTVDTLASIREEEPLCAPVLKSGSTHSITAEGGGGKSLLALEMSLAVSRGTPCLLQGSTEPKRVLYLDFEMGRAKYIRRARKMGVDVLAQDVPNLVYRQGLRLPSLDDPKGAVGLLALVEDAQAELVVIDTLSKAVLGEESSNTVFSRFARYSLSPLTDAGVAVLILDHFGYKKTRARGASAKRDNVDLNYVLKRQKGGTKDDLQLILDKDREDEGEDGRVVLKLHRVNDPVLHHMVPDELGMRPNVKRAVEFIEGFALVNEQPPTRREVQSEANVSPAVAGTALSIYRQREAA